MAGMGATPLGPGSNSLNRSLRPVGLGRSTRRILPASGMTTFSLMWPTISSAMISTGTRYFSLRLKARMVW